MYNMQDVPRVLHFSAFHYATVTWVGEIQRCGQCLIPPTEEERV